MNYSQSAHYHATKRSKIEFETQRKESIKPA